MKKISTFIGLDVHKNSIDIGIADEGREGEVRHYGTIGGDILSLEKVVRKLQSKGGTLHFVYEAGPCGYEIYRYLTSRGFDCIVVAPSMVPKKSGNRVKTDRRDSIELARLHRAGELTSVYVPRLEDEAIRDMTRARQDAKSNELKSRQQLKAFLLRNGIRYHGKTSWTAAHMRWLAEIKLPNTAQQIVFQEYVDAVNTASERVTRLTDQIRKEVEMWSMRPVVEAYEALRGVQLVVAATVVAELGDLTRFDKPGQLMAFLGLVPSEHSSGDRQRRGSITKTGNGHARRVLVEAAWQYRFPARITPIIRKRQEHLPKEVREIAWNAQLRLCRRFRYLSTQGKSKQTTVVAIARELSGFMWAISRAVGPAST